MKLWVRSQDKECLTMVNHLYTNDNCEIKQQNDLILATYKSKERALEVLDEIQNKLLKSKYDKASEDYGKHSDYKDTLIEISSSNYVYEMPEE